MFSKSFSVYSANTLDPEYIGTHDSGWKISGEIKEDCFEWVNDFQAYHPTFGYVHGNFEYEVTAASEEAYNHFVANHPPREWDYGDI